MDVEKLKDQLIRHEGLRLKPYTDTVGKLTVGIGRNLDDVGISEQEARMFLHNDLQSVYHDLNTNCPWWVNIGDVRQRVLADMVFNLGIGGFLKFKNMLLAIQSGDFNMAATEMLDSKWARQVGKRAVTLSQMMENGQD
jgi:lysozyme